MGRINQEMLQQQLEAEIRSQVDAVSRMKYYDPDKLLRQPQPGAWSVTQILDHLNSYSDFYLPEIEKAIHHAGPSRGKYKPGMIGDYFVRLMQLGDDGKPKKKMKAAARHQPDFHADPATAINKFLIQQQQLLRLLATAGQKDWGSARTKVSIATWMRIKLGDCLRFMVMHQKRHIAQMDVR